MTTSMSQLEMVEMTLSHYDAVRALWEATPGVGLDPSDERDGVARFLRRNPGLSLVAVAPRERVAGAVLCGHDGRRGYLSHMVVATEFQGRGVGRRMVERALAGLAAEGVLKCNVRVFAQNADAAGFWSRMGFAPRGDLAVMQRLSRD